jgi:hypothetical protein
MTSFNTLNNIIDGHSIRAPAGGNTPSPAAIALAEEEEIEPSGSHFEQS